MAAISTSAEKEVTIGDGMEYSNKSFANYMLMELHHKDWNIRKLVIGYISTVKNWGGKK